MSSEKKDLALAPAGGIIGNISLLATGILLGLIPLFNETLSQNFSCIWIVCFRICIAFVCISLMTFVLYTFFDYKEKFLISKNDILFFLGYGVVCITAVNYFYIKSLTLTSAAVAVITVFAVTPLTTLLVNAIFKFEKNTATEVTYILTIIFGCCLVTTQSFDMSSILGIFYAAMAGVCYGLFSIIGKKISNNHDYPVMMFWQFALAALSSIILLFIFEYDSLMTQRTILVEKMANNIIPIILIGSIATFFPYLLYSFGLKKGVRTSRASALVLMEPVSATLVAYIYMNEHISQLQFIGICIVIICSIKLTQR